MVRFFGLVGPGAGCRAGAGQRHTILGDLLVDDGLKSRLDSWFLGCGGHDYLPWFTPGYQPLHLESSEAPPASGEAALMIEADGIWTTSPSRRRSEPQRPQEPPLRLH